jgi:hypothetical protein
LTSQSLHIDAVMSNLRIPALSHKLSSPFPGQVSRQRLSCPSSGIGEVVPYSTGVSAPTILKSCRLSSAGHPCSKHAKNGQHRGSQAKCRALPAALASLAEATLARDFAAASASGVGGYFLVNIFNHLQKSGVLDQVNTNLQYPLVPTLPHNAAPHSPSHPYS